MPITLNIKDVVNADYTRVNIFSILAVMVILLFTFKSLILPILLTLVIESGIFINMAIPYYTGKEMMFLGYLIVSTIELGATIDYAILMTNNYLKRKIDAFLLEWKNTPNKKPLIVKGCRQIGKTESIRHFAISAGYESFIEINFVKDQKYKNIIIRTHNNVQENIN